jgi:hypothetical protein
LTNLSDGTQNYKVYASDIAGNVNNATLSFIVDSQKPSLSFNSPANGTNINSDSVVVNLSTSDNTGEHFSFVDDGLVSWWRMDDLNSTNGLVDYMGRNNGTLVGNTAQTENGKFGKAMNFDGNNDYVALSNRVLLGTGNLTISGWINPTSFSYADNYSEIFMAGAAAITQAGYNIMLSRTNNRISVYI